MKEKTLYFLMFNSSHGQGRRLLNFELPNFVVKTCFIFYFHLTGPVESELFLFYAFDFEIGSSYFNIRCPWTKDEIDIINLKLQKRDVNWLCTFS